MEQKLYGACERCGANIAVGHYVHCPHYVSQNRDLTELNKRLRALGGKADCNDVQDELHAAQQRIAELEAERDAVSSRLSHIDSNLTKAKDTALLLVDERDRLIDELRDAEARNAQKLSEIARLREALSDLIDVAAQCDSWDSFPSTALEAASLALENGDE